MKIKLPLILALVTLCSISVYAQQQQPKYTYSVAVLVSGDDQFKNDVRSYISRELRSLGDIVLVDASSDPIYRISIIAIRIGTHNAFAFSTNVTLPTSEEFAQTLISKCSGKEDRERLMRYLTRNETILKHYLMTGGDLRKLCTDLVAEIDGSVFEPQRTFDQSEDDLLRKRRSQQPPRRIQ